MWKRLATRSPWNAGRSPSCPHYGKRRRIPLFIVIDGVLARPGFYCAGCHMELMDVSEAEDVDVTAPGDHEQRTVPGEA